MTSPGENPDPPLTTRRFLGVEVSYAPKGYSMDPGSDDLVSDAELEEAKQVMETAHERREARLEALYASLASDPDRLGLVYQAVGGGTDPEKFHRTGTMLLALSGTMTALLGAWALSGVITGDSDSVGGGLLLGLLPCLATWLLYKHRRHSRALVKKGRALTTRRLGDDPTVFTQVEEASADPDAERLAGAIRIIRERQRQKSSSSS